MSTTEPDDGLPDDLEGELSTVTDDEWRAAHDAVTRDILAAAPEGHTSSRREQFEYEWSPGE